MQFNFNPKVWGASFWYILHLITFGYPDEPTYIEQRGYHDFFVNLQHVIPCYDCRKHYRKHLQESPITPYLSSKANLIKWLVDVHNKVNTSLNKPHLTVEEAIKSNVKPPIKTVVTNICPKRQIKWFRALLILLCLLLIIYYYKFLRNPLS